MTTKKSTTKKRAKKNSTKIKEIKKKLDYSRFVVKNPSPVLEINNKNEILVSNPAAKKLFGKDVEKKQLPDILENFDKKEQKGKGKTEGGLVQIEQQINKETYLFTFQKDTGSSTVFIYGSNITSLKKTEEAHAKKISELEEFHELIEGRESRMIELKKEVNGFLKEKGEKPKYGLPKAESSEVPQ